MSQESFPGLHGIFPAPVLVAPLAPEGPGEEAMLDPLADERWDPRPPPALAELLAVLDTESRSGDDATPEAPAAAVLRELQALEATVLRGVESFMGGTSERVRQPSEEVMRAAEAALSGCCVAFEAATSGAALAATGMARQRFEVLSRLSERRVCQYAFKRNDIVWICKECQADETCVLCNDCFIDSEHEGHEVYFYHAQAGGCCDCGDQYAWDPQGCCSRHGKSQADPLRALPEAFARSTGDVVRACVAYLTLYARHERFSHDLARHSDLAPEASWPRLASDTYFCMLLEDEIHADQEFDQVLRGLASRHAFGGSEAAMLRALRGTCGFVMVKEGTLDEVREVAAQLAAPLKPPRRLRGPKQRGLVAVATTRGVVEMRLVGMAVIDWLHHAAELSDGVCRLVAREFSAEVLDALFELDAYLPRPVKEGLNAMYLHLMSDAPFKRLLADAYAHAFPSITTSFQRGLGLIDTSVYSLSVQFLNRAMFVAALRQQKDFYRVIAAALYRSLLFTTTDGFRESFALTAATLDAEPRNRGLQAYLDVVAPNRLARAGVDEDRVRASLDGLRGGGFRALAADMERWEDGLFDGPFRARCLLADALAVPHPSHWVLRSRRYIPIMSDLKCILTVPGVAPCFWADAGPIWLRVLTLAQGHHEQQRQFGRHIEYEDEHWMFAFNLFISLNTSFEGLLSWLGETDPKPAPQPEASTVAAVAPLASQAPLDGARLASLAARAAGPGGAGVTAEFLRYIHEVEAVAHGTSALPDHCLASIGAALGSYHLAQAQNGRRPFAVVPPLAKLLAQTTAPLEWLCVGVPLPAQSFHLPLHRFWAAALRQAARVTHVDPEVAGRCLPRLGEGKAGAWAELLAEAKPEALLVGLCAVCIPGYAVVPAGVPRTLSGLEVPSSWNPVEPVFQAWLDYGAFGGQILDKEGAQPEGNVARKGLVGDLLDEVSRVLVLAAQVSSGMWRRNGVAIVDQVNNYADGPFYRIFRDLDLIAVQFTGLLYGPDALISHLVHAFGFFDALAGPMIPATPNSLVQADMEFAVPLLEYLLQLLIILVTELPQPPDMPRDASAAAMEGPKPSLLAALRREMVHKLVTASRTHSELGDCAAVLFRLEPLAPAVVGDVIREIAVEKREEDLLAPTKYELRPELWTEYDPCYFHLTRQEHQAAMANRPAPKRPTPLCGPPTACHPLFTKWRRDFLSSGSLFFILHEVLKHIKPAPAPEVPDADAMDVENRAAPRLFSDILALRCLQLLSLAIHVETAATDDLSTLDLSAPATFYERLAAFREGALLTVLAQLGEHLEEATSKAAAQWIVKMVKKDPVCGKRLEEVLPQKDAKAKGKGRTRARAKLAQQRAAERMKKRALDFAREYGGEEVGEEEGEESDGDGAEEEHSPDCIICRARTLEPLHFVAFGERARVLAPHPHSHFGRGQRDACAELPSDGMAPPASAMGTAAASTPPPAPAPAPELPSHRPKGSGALLGDFAQSLEGGAGLFVQGCGHALHLSCFRHYYIAGASGRSVHALIPDRGEFSCPLCQQVGNLLVPLLPATDVIPAAPHESPTAASIPQFFDHHLALHGPPRPAAMEHGRQEAMETSGPLTMPTPPMFTAPMGMSDAVAMNAPSPTHVGVATEEAEAPFGTLSGATDPDAMEPDAVPAATDLTGDLGVLSVRYLASLWDVWHGKPSLHEAPLRTSDLSSPIPPMKRPDLSPAAALGAISLTAYTAAASEAELGIGVVLASPTAAPLERSLGSRNPGLGLQKRLVHSAAAVRALRAALHQLPASFRAAVLQLAVLRLAPQPLLDQRNKEEWTDAGPTPVTLLEAPLGSFLALLCAAQEITPSFVRHAVAVTWLLRLWQLCAAELHGTAFGFPSGFAEPPAPLRLLDPEGAVAPSATLALLRSVGRAGQSRGDLVPCLAQDLEALDRRFAAATAAHLRSAAVLLGWLVPAATESLRLAEDPAAFFALPPLTTLAESDQLLNYLAGWWSPSLTTAPLLRFQGVPRRGIAQDMLKALVLTGRLADLPRPALIELPGDYTELHARFSSTVRQALCLVCGTLLVVDGSGHASEHAKACGCGQGIFYLIREGNVLLVHGPKAAYFPSPYVDSYGERQRKFRTIPLKLEARRWEVVQRLWAQHGISIEVAHQRATARQVIVDNWY